jgi:hypothetical protein
LQTMKHFAVLFLLVGLLVGLMPTLAAQEEKPDTQAGNFLFSVPTGWNPQEKGDTTLIFAPSPPPGTTTVIAMAASDLDGDLQKSFNELWSGLANSYRILQGGQIAPMHAKKGYDAFYASAVAVDKNGTRWQVFVMGAQYKNRIQTVMFMSNLPPGTMYSAYFKVFEHWLANLSFGDALPGSNIPPAGAGAAGAEAAAEAPHNLPPGALEGFYVGMSLGYGGRVGRNPLYFSPDGWVVKIDLNNSMVGFDLTRYRNAKDTNRSWVGRYRVDGNQINILWQDYTEHRDVIQRNEASAHPGLDTYVPMCRCTGLRFSGKYNYGLAGAGKYMQFFPDGTFIDHGVLDQKLLPNPYYEHPRTQRGTYTIQSQTMIFNFSDGHRGMQTFMGPKAQEKRQLFDWITLGGDSLYEEHHQNEP